eukprot:CAMPEP_0202442356 /NCGR_PEP_ID=MMETSP1360-20130828/1810_1 /ASSEMBLY_ACC=CAM_ASM_000848 /TAXON_ID=515479 /ORGANISM="Licmophora paradoxa, Strain CCMP2313" /LENGTH=183 /DNA_ID=CAMNT_0049057701 /DNA_START=1 /DNA_END=552 /DNA_ORIENTATION=+
MPPRSIETQCYATTFDNERNSDTLERRAALELESIKGDGLHPFPSACYQIMTMLPGNEKCVDCGSACPDWATVSYGALICMRCSGRHRGLGVKYSKVRSVTMDHWSHQQILQMLEGGNQQLNGFFERHQLSSVGQSGQDNIKKRYFTKAASFYRNGIHKHAEKVKGSGLYKGRKVYRKSCERC